MLGAMTLVTDVLTNELENDIHFDNIFIDAGSGLTAIAFILAFNYLGKEFNQFYCDFLLFFQGRNSKIHVVQMAGKHDEFIRNLRAMEDNFAGK